MKAILRVVVVCQSGVGPYLETCIDKLKSFLADLCACPGNPGFSHHLFETIAALIGSVCTESPTKVPTGERGGVCRGCAGEERCSAHANKRAC